MNPSSVSASGSIRKQVICESCRHPYDYKMKRTTYGSFSGFVVTRAEADEKAALDAAEKLRTILDRECDIIPCPKCSSLTAQMRETKGGFIPQCIGGMAIGGTLAGGVYLIGRSTGRWFYVAGIIGGAAFLICGLALVVQVLDVASGGGSDGWQSKVKPRTVRGIAYVVMLAGLGIMAYSFAGGIAFLAIGSVVLLVGGVILSAAKDRDSGKPPQTGIGE